jgi:hypothetical protein
VPKVPVVSWIKIAKLLEHLDIGLSGRRGAISALRSIAIRDIEIIFFSKKK